MKSNDAVKRRDICFNAMPPNQAEQARTLLASLDRLEVFPSPHAHTIVVQYNVLDYTLQGLESALVSQGFHLDNSLFHKIKRALIHYLEDVQLDNLRSPDRQTKSSREIFINAYGHHEHGDHDATPPEWRDYR
jgi:hypothetical protein